MKRIIFYECKKAFTSPIILTLAILFAAYNIFLIHNSSDFKEELHAANELADTYGLSIINESLGKLKKDLIIDLKELNERAEKPSSKEFGSAAEFLHQLRFDDHELYTENDRRFFQTIFLKEMYLETAESIEKNYQEINIIQSGESEINRYGLSGSAAETYRNQYKMLSARFDELQENGEHTQWFFAGKHYFMHSLLFKTVFKHLIFETLILLVLGTALITNYEYENRTHLSVYSTKRGRNVMKDKLAASFIVTTVIAFLLFILTLSSYFIIFDYSHLFKSSINSAFNWEYQFPYVSWWNLTFFDFLLLAILVVYICMLLFTALTFVISVWLKNSYYTVFLFWVMFAVFFMLQGFVLPSSNFIFLTGFNLSTLIMNPHVWFTANNGLLVFKYYELITIAAWTILLAGLCIVSLTKFKKWPIH